MTNEIESSLNSSIATIAKRIPKGALEKVTQRLPEIAAKTEAFGRNNSQTTLSMMTLTMMTGQSPHRQIRQILAEIERRQTALAEAQVSYAQLLEKEPDKNDSEEVFEAKQRLKQFQISQIQEKIAGSFKDIATLINAYDNITKNYGMEAWSEEDFEKAEARHHIRRGFELLYHDIVEYSRPKKSSIEYLQQFGVHIQLANREVQGYITFIETQINQGKKDFTASNLEDFLDEMADKYQNCAKEAASRMFGTEEIINADFMMNWKK